MGTINFTQILSATLVLLSIIDIVGSIPIILQLRDKGRHVDATKATVAQDLQLRYPLVCHGRRFPDVPDGAGDDP